MGATLTETLLAPSTIRLFGRKFTGLAIGDLGLGAASTNPLVQRLTAAKAGDQKDPANQFGLARIYGFSYLGNYFKLTAPTVLLVWGPGAEMPAGIAHPLSMDQSGVEFQDESFVKEIRMWAVDQLDLSVRIDLTIGWMRDIFWARRWAAATTSPAGRIWWEGRIW